MGTHTPNNVPDPVINVRVPTMERTEWRISQNLTDRWGDLNEFDEEKKPLARLREDEAFLEKLQQQMWGEDTFVVRKDGEFGILFEVEFYSMESEESHSTPSPEWYATLKPYEAVVSAILQGMAPLVEQYPGVMFAVPAETEVIYGRPAAWAFVPDGLLDDMQRDALGVALNAL